MANLITARAYAKHRKCNDKTVRDAINQGQITAVKKDGKVWIDPAVADKEWAQNRATKGAKGDEDYAKARAVRERANAELAVLKVAEAKARLIDVHEVERQGFAIGHRIKSALETISTKLGPIVASETDAHECEIIIAREVNQVLENLSKIRGYE